MTPADVRRGLVDALRLDLVGPENGTDLEAEVLPQAPSRWYLTGFLVPLEAGESQRTDETGEDDFALTGGEAEGTDDATPPEPAAARRAFFPSSIGLGVLVPQSARNLHVVVHWGDYKAEPREAEEAAQEKSGADALGRGHFLWKRTPRRAELALELPAQTSRAVEQDVQDSEGLRIAVSVRP